MATNLGTRVALLARPGAACERVRGALNEIGADLVLEGDPNTLEPAKLENAHAQFLLVLLDPGTEDALDRFDATLSDPRIEVMFEEAEIVARRDGWDAARWQRHLSVKLNLRRDVLPAGIPDAPLNDDAPLAAAAPAASPPSSLDLPVSATSTAAQGLAQAVEAIEPGLSLAGSEAASGFAFDPVAAEMDGSDFGGSDLGPALTLEGFSGDIDSSLDMSGVEVFDPNAFAEIGQAPSVPPPPLSPEFDPALAGLELEASLHEYLPADFDPGLSLDGLTGPDPHVAPPLTEGLSQSVAAGAPAPRDTGARDLDDLNRRISSLSLVDDSPAAAPSAAPAKAAPSPTLGSSLSLVDDAPKAPVAASSLGAGLSLVDDTPPVAAAGLAMPPAAPAPITQGAVLVMAGIGGPDAVRQLLGALPEGFARPVLVQQRLDGGRYDRLVTQMQRATRLEVHLATAGMLAQPGCVYIMPAEVSVEVGDYGVRFLLERADKVLDRLSSADSAVLLLSGSDAERVDAVMHHAWAGALVAGQSPEGCYDAAAPEALVKRGGQCGSPVELAQRLTERWGTSAPRMF